MNPRFTYKEISLAFGIVVAIVIIMMIWFYPSANETSETGSQLEPFLKLHSFKTIIQKIEAIIHLVR
ncbi:MAG: hypothetical protein KF687_07560 [Cyclobacteriaceae bacterium]|nr:hypothetical protein [Cyclobacteriaceae bacterium]